MKIEMAEQMMASYLKNIERCLTVQENWTPAPKHGETVDAKLSRVETIIEDIKASLLGVDFMKKSHIKQFIMQSEIDVVGVKEDDAGDRHVFLLDSAFHENGLNYKNTIETVIKKLVRAALVGDLFFPGYIVHVQFISPKVSHSRKKKILGYEETIMKVMEKYNPDIKFELYLDEDLYPLIIDLISILDEVADSNDLFMRAAKMLRMFDLIKMPKPESSSHDEDAIITVSDIETKKKNKDKILDTINDLIKDDKLNDGIIKLLTTSDYTRKMFSISSFPFLKKAEDVVEKLARRYYTQLININGDTYRVVNQWTDVTLSKFDEWVQTLKK